MPRPDLGRSAGKAILIVVVLVLSSLAGVLSGLGLSHSVGHPHGAAAARATAAAREPSGAGSRLLSLAAASLERGNGPAGGQPWTCPGPTLAGLRCTPVAGGGSGIPRGATAPDARPSPAAALFAVGGYPKWYDVTYRVDAGFTGPDTVGGGAAYDPNLGEVVLVGGCAVYLCPTYQTWLFNGTTWLDDTLNLSGVTPAVGNPSVVWDPQFNAVLAIGGIRSILEATNNSTYYVNVPTNATYEFTGSGWVNITSTVGAFDGSVGAAAAAYDDALHEVVLVGGCPYPYCGVGFNDYWTLNRSGWHDAGVGPAIGAGSSRVVGASMAFDRSLDQLVLYGGYLGTGYINTTFMLNASGWHNLTLSSAEHFCFFSCGYLYPEARGYAAMTWSTQLGVLFLVGGNNASATLNDSWYFSNDTWVPSGIFFISLPGPAVTDGAMPSNSSAIAPALIGGYCTTSAGFGCPFGGGTRVFEIGPRPTIYGAAQDPARLSQLNISAGWIAGSGSGPDVRWTFSDNVGHHHGGSAVGYNFTQNLSASSHFLYNGSGNYALTLTADDYFHVVNSTGLNLTLTVPLAAAPVAVPTPTELGIPVGFASEAYGGEAPYHYLWTFGDGSAESSLAAPSHLYAAPGTYVAWLNVTDTGANWSNQSVSVVVAPDLSVSATTNLSATDLGLPVGFTATPKDGSGVYSTFAWSFGDGRVSSVAAPTHVYTATGSYLASVTVTDTLGVSANATTQAVTVNAPPGASVNSTPASPTTATPVDFTAVASGGTTPFAFAWQFGDGTNGSGRTPSHSYATTGTYNVTLTVTDAVGAHATAGYVVTIGSSGPLAAVPGALPNPGEVGVPVAFSVAPTGGSGGYALLWGFGDGPAVSKLLSPSHTYSAAGTYPAWVLVTDSLGASVNVSLPVAINWSLGVNPSATLSTAEVGQSIGWSAGAVDGVRPYVSFAWNFGDGATSGLAAPTHVFAASGTFHVAVTVTDSLGVLANETIAYVIHALPIVSINATASQSSTGEAVTFTAEPTGGIGPYSFAWSFGDGASGTGASAEHSYSSVGTYTVRVILTDEDGGRATSAFNESVTASSSRSGGGPSSWFAAPGLYVIVGLVAALVAALVTLLVVRARRRSPPPPPPPVGGGEPPRP